MPALQTVENEPLLAISQECWTALPLAVYRLSMRAMYSTNRTRRGTEESCRVPSLPCISRYTHKPSLSIYLSATASGFFLTCISTLCTTFRKLATGWGGWLPVGAVWYVRTHVALFKPGVGEAKGRSCAVTRSRRPAPDRSFRQAARVSYRTARGRRVHKRTGGVSVWTGREGGRRSTDHTCGGLFDSRVYMAVFLSTIIFANPAKSVVSSTISHRFGSVEKLSPTLAIVHRIPSREEKREMKSNEMKE